MKKKFKTELIFPIAVIILSLFGLLDQLSYIHYPALLISILGIAGGILYFLKIKFYKPLIYVWIISQLIIISTSSVFENFTVENKIWDTSQFLKLQLGFTINSSNTQTDIYFNFVPIFMLGLLKLLSVSDLIGETITFKKFRRDNKFGDIFPFNGTVLRRVPLSNEKDWLLVELESPITYKNHEIQNIFIKSKDDQPLKKGKKGQLASVRIIEDIQFINFDHPIEKTEFKFVDNVRVI